MIDSKIKPQPGEGGGINTINQNGTGLQKEEPGATIPDRDPGFECLKEDQVQAEVTTLFTFAEACAQPGAKRFMFHGSDGPVNAVEVDGTFFIQNDEAEAKAGRSKALELASEELAVESKASANPAATAEEVAAAPTPMPEPAAAHRISYAAAASKSLVGPKPSEPRPVPAAKFSAGLERSTPVTQPAVVPAPLEVSAYVVAQPALHRIKYVRMCMHVCLKTFGTTPNQPGGGRLCHRPEHPVAEVYRRRRGRQGLSAALHSRVPLLPLRNQPSMCFLCSPPPKSRASSARVIASLLMVRTGGRVPRSPREVPRHCHRPEGLLQPVLRGQGGGRGAVEEDQGRGGRERDGKEVGGFEAGHRCSHEEEDAPEAGQGHEDHGADDGPGPGQGRRAGMTTPHSESDPTHPRGCDSVCSLDLPSMARRCTALRASVPSSSLASLHSLPPSTSRSHRPRRPSSSQRGSRRGSVLKAGPFSSLGI